MFCHENLFNPTKMFLLLIKLYPSVILSDVRRELATEDESKDPENISLTTPRQGVLTKLLVIILKLGFAATVNAKAKAKSQS